MNFIQDIKAKRIANYVIRTIKRYYKNINKYDYYISLIKPNKLGPVVLNVRFDSDKEMRDGFWKYYERYKKEYKNEYPFSSPSLKKCIKQYKQRPSVKFYKTIQNIFNRYDKSTLDKKCKLYGRVNSYITNAKFKINLGKGWFCEVSKVNIFKSVINGCRIIVK